MTEVQIVSFTPNSPDPLFKVIYAPNSGRCRKELPVVGTVLSKVTVLEAFTPASYHTLSPAFVYRDQIVLGETYWDAQKDGGEIMITPITRRKRTK